MRIIRTDRALAGIREVAEYIARDFGKKALQEFRKRLSKWTKTIKEQPGVGEIDWEISTADRLYMKVLIYRRSWMVIPINPSRPKGNTNESYNYSKAVIQ